MRILKDLEQGVSVSAENKGVTYALFREKVRFLRSADCKGLMGEANLQVLQCKGPTIFRKIIKEERESLKSGGQKADQLGAKGS